MSNNLNVTFINAFKLWKESIEREMIALHDLHHITRQYTDHFSKDILTGFAIEFIKFLGFTTQLVNASTNGINHYVFSKPLSYKQDLICTFFHK